MHSTTRPVRRVALAATAGCLALALAACGSSDAEDPSTASATTSGAATTPAAQPTTAADQPTTGGAALTRPVIKPGTGKAPTKLVIKDDVVGKGAEAVAGTTVSVQYVGAAFETGKEFDASWNRGQPFQFSLGAGQVIQGWDQGVAGMKVGGRRTLVIPPDLGYGEAGSPPVIEPNETLVFVVDLIALS
jgi:peptidylprolyl isomerase